MKKQREMTSVRMPSELLGRLKQVQALTPHGRLSLSWVIVQALERGLPLLEQDRRRVLADVSS